MKERDSGRSARSIVARWLALPLTIACAAWGVAVTSAMPPVLIGWSALDGGTNGRVRALAVFDDGSGGGPSLYAAGAFDLAGGVEVNNIARWDGTAWHVVGGGVSGASSTVMCMNVADTGDGSMLFLGGWFTDAEGMEVDYVTAWNGVECCALSSGMDSGVLALASFDDGSGPALYAGGLFTMAGGVPANHIAKWDGQTWSPVGLGFDGPVYTLATFFDGIRPALYAGGDFSYSGETKVKHIAKWDGDAWAPVGSGTNDTVHALAGMPEGSRRVLVAGGIFTKAGGLPAEYLAKWNGHSWSPLVPAGTGPNDSVHALAMYNDGAGPALYIGGQFTTVNGVPTPHITAWTGRNWVRLGPGVNDRVQSLAVFDDGTGPGPALYVGGVFTAAGEFTVNHIARWGWTVPE